MSLGPKEKPEEADPQDPETLGKQNTNESTLTKTPAISNQINSEIPINQDNPNQTSNEQPLINENENAFQKQPSTKSDNGIESSNPPSGSVFGSEHEENISLNQLSNNQNDQNNSTIQKDQNNDETEI